MPKKSNKKGIIKVIGHDSQIGTSDDYDNYDYLIGMDTANIRNMNRIAGGDPDEKLRGT